jgi:hypothetical protein
MTFELLSHALNFGAGLLVRFLNEGQKDRQMQFEMAVAAASQRHEFMAAAKDQVVKTPVLQAFLGLLLIASLSALIAFPLLAVVWEVPLTFIFERVVETGFWIFSSTELVTTIEQTTGLYLPKEFQVVIIAILEFITGAVVGGLGRR